MALLASIIVVPPNLNAQTQAEEPQKEPEAPTIGKVVINFTGLSNVNEEVARANMALREGVPYDPVTVDRDIRSLYRSGLFEYIEVRLASAGEGVVDVIFDIRPKFRISAISFEGNERFSNSRLERELKEIAVNLVLNEPNVKAGAETLQEFYLKRGFSQARVDYEIDRSPSSGYGTVTFLIKEGRKFKIGKIAFDGNEAFTSRKLRKKMETKKWGFFSVITGSGKFNQDKFEDDLEKLKDEYRNKGYLDIDIDPARVRFDYPSKRRMRITVDVDEGKQYKVGSIDFVGNEVYKTDILKLMLRVLPGAIYEPEKLDEDVERIEKFYGQFGYMETRVRLEREPNVETGDIDLNYRVYESEQFKVESIDIEGNTKTKSVVVLRELALSPGSSFDSVRMESSRMRLENSRYFEDVNVTDQSTNIPGRKDLRITFNEGRTGNFSFGAGFSSLEGGVFFVELTQSNFDILNWRGAFQGDGQKFRLKASFGGQSTQVILSFEEPWLFERRLAFGFTIFDTSTDYDGLSYDQFNKGFEVYLRKRLFELVEGRLSYSLSENDFVAGQGVSEDEEFRLLSSRGVTSSLSLTLSRDTRDRLINPYRGARLELQLDSAGGALGGDFDFYKIETRNAFYLPLAERFSQTIEFLVRAGVVNESSDDSLVPWNQRFFLGGPSTLRGFELREVSPLEAQVRTASFAGTIDSEDDLVVAGPAYYNPGKTYGMLGIEYSFGLTDDFRIAAFYDGGFVNRDAWDFSTSQFDDVQQLQTGRNPADLPDGVDLDDFLYDNYLISRPNSGWNDNWGVGIRMSMMGTPLRLDYAIPITTSEVPDVVNDQNLSNDKGGQFNFTFGGRF